MPKLHPFRLLIRQRLFFCLSGNHPAGAQTGFYIICVQPEEAHDVLEVAVEETLVL